MKMVRIINVIVAVLIMVPVAFLWSIYFVAESIVDCCRGIFTPKEILEIVIDGLKEVAVEYRQYINTGELSNQ